jgi:FkbM family methyltransferase
MIRSLKKFCEYVACARSLGATPIDSFDILWSETKNLRVRIGVARHRPDRIYSVNTRYGRFFFRDNFGDITNLTNLIFRDVYGIRKLRAPGVILDVGANIGLAAAWISYFNPDRPIHCFEPLAGNVELVRKNCPHARVKQVAVGAQDGRVSLAVDSASVMASSIPCAWSTRLQTFPTTSLDTFAHEAGIADIALLKIDAEGMELEILEGARGILPRVAQLAMETHGHAVHETVLDLLRSAGFQIDSAEFNGHTGMVFTSRACNEVSV